MGISGISSMSGYNVLGVYGNPGSVKPIKRVTEDSQQKSPLVTVAKDQENQVAEQSSLPATTSTTVNSFADTMKMQQLQTDDTDANPEADTQLVSSLNDAIGVMGFQNSLRMQLTGMSFQAFGTM